MKNSRKCIIFLLVLCLSLTLLSGCAGRYSLPDEAPGEYGSMTGELVEILEWANFVIRNFEDGKLYRFQLAYGGDLGDYEIGTAMYVEYIVEDHEGEIVCMCLILSSVEEQNAYVARQEQRESYE